ncbi:MAG: DUF3426 domain-containing protein, partial [Ferrovibrionaceae bacterium]
VLVLVLIGLLAGLWFGRDKLVALWPPAMTLYEKLHIPVKDPADIGLELREVTPARAMEGQKSILVITGQVVSTSSSPRTVPPLKVTLRNEAGEAVYTQSFALFDAPVGPGAKENFAIRLDDVPGAQNVALDFEAATPQKHH